uniref:F-box domain-containing protein n=1 Tax=Panagrolaimus sp. ES5 TaxID=591445 RepID=A0AC34FEX5_9BILA
MDKIQQDVIVQIGMVDAVIWVKLGQMITLGCMHVMIKEGNAPATFAGCLVLSNNELVMPGKNISLNGFWYSCDVNTLRIKYDQEPRCLVNGSHYHVGEQFREGYFQWLCLETGRWVTGCYYQNETKDWNLLKIGEKGYNGLIQHVCDRYKENPGRIQYIASIRKDIPHKSPTNKGKNQNLLDFVDNRLKEEPVLWTHDNVVLFIESKDKFNQKIRTVKSIDKNVLWETAVAQNFSLPSTILKYVFENVTDYRVLRKLHLSCKYFLFNHDFLILNGLFVSHNTYNETPHISFMKYFLVIAPNHPVLWQLKNVWLAGMLRVSDSNNKLTASLLPMITRCHVTKIQLYNQCFTEDEFKILTKSRTLEVMDFSSVTVQKSDGSYLPFDDMIAMTPNLRELKLYPITTSAATNRKLALIEKPVKFSILNLDTYPNLQFPQGFAMFLKNNLAPKAKVILSKANYYISVIETISKWDPADEKPALDWSDKVPNSVITL